jgi:hypothetical protein
VKHPAADCPCKPGPLDDLDDYVEASDAALARAAAELLLLADEEERLRAPALERFFSKAGKLHDDQRKKRIRRDTREHRAQSAH